jgi:hypothetical protein
MAHRRLSRIALVGVALAAAGVTVLARKIPLRLSARHRRRGLSEHLARLSRPQGLIGRLSHQQGFMGRLSRRPRRLARRLAG